LAFIIRIRHDARSSDCQIINLIYFISVLLHSCHYYIRLTIGRFHRGFSSHTSTYISRPSVVQSSSFLDIRIYIFFFTSFLEVLISFSYLTSYSQTHLTSLAFYKKERTANVSSNGEGVRVLATKSRTVISQNRMKIDIYHRIQT
jgi:hypothetical protein